MAILYRIPFLSLLVSHKDTGDASSSSADSTACSGSPVNAFPVPGSSAIRLPVPSPLSGVQEILLNGAKSSSQRTVIRVIRVEADFHIFRIHAVKVRPCMADQLFPIGGKAHHPGIHHHGIGIEQIDYICHHKRLSENTFFDQCIDLWIPRLLQIKDLLYGEFCGIPANFFQL